MIGWSLGAAAIALAARLTALRRARRRLSRWPTLGAAEAATMGDVVFLTAPGVHLDERIRRRAAAHLASNDFDAIDLVPSDLDVRSALEIASVTEPAMLARDLFARTAGAGHAMAIRDTLWRRALIEPPADAAGIAAAAERLRRFAAGRTGTAIAPGTSAIPEHADARAAMLKARTGIGMGPRLYLEGLWWALLAMALLTDVRVGLFALVVVSIAPSFVFAGLALRPRDRWRSLATRLPSDLLAWLRACLSPDSRPAIDAARPDYAQLIAGGTAPFFSARRDRCPFCGDARLVPHVTTTDLVQRKPGRFTLERCGGCGVIFQNPALSPRGLGYYYRDFYDGLGAETMDEVFASTHALYRARVDAVRATGDAPARWLDLGCGYAHFALAARRELTATRFEGLDQSESVEEGWRRGWLDRAWRMTTADLVATGERFDVVSLFHYLEHTQDPASEIALAARLVAPGGRLVIEIPNPRCRLGRWLGRWWFPWFQPQHQTLLDEATVRRLLSAAACEPLSVTYLMTAGDLLLSAMLFARRGCSPGDVPWAPRPGALRRVADWLIWAAALPLFVAALIGDAIYGALAASPETSNAFRVIATRRE